MKIALALNSYEIFKNVFISAERMFAFYENDPGSEYLYLKKGKQRNYEY